MTSNGTFPTTRLIVHQVASRSEEERSLALDRVTRVYYRPVVAYVRARWRRSTDDTEELVQEFFANVLEREVLAAFDPKRGRFRAFLCVCIDRFVLNWLRARRAAKRGGGVAILSLEEGLAAEPAAEANRIFEMEWAKQIFTQALEAMREHCVRQGKREHLQVFELYDLLPPEERLSYNEIAAKLGLRTHDVTNRLHYARKLFRRFALEQLRAAVVSDEEFRLEARCLFGGGGHDG